MKIDQQLAKLSTRVSVLFFFTHGVYPVTAWTNFATQPSRAWSTMQKFPSLIVWSPREILLLCDTVWAYVGRPKMLGTLGPTR